jgi:electron transfer flavoprotein beta subunit
MKIAVCFKTIPEYDMLSGQDWKVDDQNFVDIRYVKQVFNCFDESALEIALKISDQQQGVNNPVESTALTIDNQGADLFLKHLLALQYDKAVRIACQNDLDLRFNALSVSELISAYVKQMGQQLVITGAHGGVGDNRQTGLLVAEHLRWPCIRDVIDVNLSGYLDHLRVTSYKKGAFLSQTITLPVVLVIGNAPDSPCLRVPTLKQKLGAKTKKIAVFTQADLGMDSNALTLKDKTLEGLWQEKSDQNCDFISAKSAREKAQLLYDQYLKQRLPG